MKFLRGIVALAQSFLNGFRVSIEADGNYSVWGKKEGTQVVTCSVDVAQSATLEQMQHWGAQIAERIHNGKDVVVNFHKGTRDISGFVACYRNNEIHDMTTD